MTDKEKNITQKKLIAALKKHDFNVTLACKEIGISRRTYYNWISEEDSDFDELVDEADDECIDMVISSLYKRANGYEIEQKITKNGPKGEEVTIRIIHFPPETAAMKLYLEARAKHRGYGDQKEAATNSKKTAQFVENDESSPPANTEEEEVKGKDS